MFEIISFLLYTLQVSISFSNMHIELQFLSFSVVILFTFLFLKLYIRMRTYYKDHPSRSVEGLVYYFYIKGIFNNKLNNEVPEAPEYSMFTRLLKYLVGFLNLFNNDALVTIWIGILPFTCLIQPEAIEEVLNGTKANEKAWFYQWLDCWLGTGLLTSHGSKWKSRRKLLTPSFHFDVLKDFQPIINEKSMKLVKKLEKEVDEEYTNISPLITLCSLDIICETTLGVNVNVQENSESEYVKAVARVTESITRRLSTLWSWFDFTYFLTKGKSVKKDLELLHSFTKSIIQDKKAKLLAGESRSNTKNKRKALMDVLLEHHIETKDLTEEDIREEVDTFTFEGHDTTSTGLTWALYLIGLHNEVQEKIQEELDLIFGSDAERPVDVDDLKDMKYLECVIKESLRLYPSVPMIGRKADQDMNICGYSVPKGACLIITPYHLHHLAAIYPNPYVFDPSRFTPENSAKRHPYAYIPFSAGSRNCIGQRFAMMEEKTVLANILRNYKVESLDQRDKLAGNFEIILRPSRPIRIKFSRRQHDKC